MNNTVSFKKGSSFVTLAQMLMYNLNSFGTFKLGRVSNTHIYSHPKIKSETFTEGKPFQSRRLTLKMGKDK